MALVRARVVAKLICLSRTQKFALSLFKAYEEFNLFADVDFYNFPGSLFRISANTVSITRWFCSGFGDFQAVQGDHLSRKSAKPVMQPQRESRCETIGASELVRQAPTHTHTSFLILADFHAETRLQSNMPHNARQHTQYPNQSGTTNHHEVMTSLVDWAVNWLMEQFVFKNDPSTIQVTAHHPETSKTGWTLQSSAPLDLWPRPVDIEPWWCQKTRRYVIAYHRPLITYHGAPMGSNGGK